MLEKVTAFLETRLKLKVNQAKSGVARPWERKFLGYSVTRQKEPKLKVANESVLSLKSKLRKVFRCGRGRKVETQLKDLQPLIRGWMNYFKYSEVKGVFEELDGWIRRKIRCIYWRQWKKPKTRERKLKQLGLSAQQAWKSANNGRGPWWNAGASHMHLAMPTQRLGKMGLLSFIDEYRRITCC